MFKNEASVLDTLTKKGLISQGQIQSAEEFSHIVKKPLLDSICEMGLVSRKAILESVAQEYGFELIDLLAKEIPREIIQGMDPALARRYKVIPVAMDKREIKIAMADPFDVEAIDQFEYRFGKSVAVALADPDDLEKALNKYYGVTDETVDEMLHQMEGGDATLLQAELLSGEAILEDSDAPIVKLVNLLITEAFKNRASDIHLEPLQRKFRVRYRIDGVLQEVQAPPKRLQPSVLSRIKIMSNMSIAEKRLPQDGRININVVGKEIDLRVSSIPTNHGESIVLRLLDKTNLLMGLGQLGFLSDEEKKFGELIRQPNGIILITGPTGSGKTTTLYACLNYLNRPDRKLITVEDPVEYQIPGINQIQVNETIGLSFANVLRSILRQAPNIIMVGEIRDHETAEIAVHAALTGHLVFSTLHTNDAPGAVTRLIDQKVKPFLVASSVIGILAQRLVRVICSQCKEAHRPPDYEIKTLKAEAEKGKEMVFYKGKGCDSCNGTGYRGRIAITELLEVDESIRKLIYESASSLQIRKRARELGMRTLREDGIQKSLAGTTTLEEVYRTTMEDED